MLTLFIPRTFSISNKLPPTTLENCELMYEGVLTLSPSTTDKKRLTLSGAAFPNRPIMIRPEPVAPVIVNNAWEETKQGVY